MQPRPATALIAVCVAIGSYAGVLASAAPPSAATRPLEAAVLVHDGQRLALADLQTGALRSVSEEGVAAREPVWSPTGARLSYRIEDRLRVHVDGIMADRPLFEVPGLKEASPYVYSPDEKWIAVTLQDGVALVALPADPRGATPRQAQRVPLPACGVPDLFWSPDAKSLRALCFQTRSIVRIAVDTLATSAQPAKGVLRMIGWSSDGALIVATRRGAGEEPALLMPSGSLRRLHAVEPGEFILAALPGPGQILLVTSNEGDFGYPTVLRLVGPTPKSSRPWLRGFGSIGEFNFTSDGWWALFVKLLGADRRGGDVYLVATGSDKATQVLAATPEMSYSSPMPRPLGHR